MQLAALRVIELCQQRRSTFHMGEKSNEFIQQCIIVHVTDVMAVQVFQLGKIKTCRRFSNIAKFKPFHQLRRGEDFIVTMAPAQPRQIIAQRCGQVTHGAVSLDT